MFRKSNDSMILIIVSETFEGNISYVSRLPEYTGFLGDHELLLFEFPVAGELLVSEDSPPPPHDSNVQHRKMTNESLNIDLIP
jgi:hypothetical protein